MTLFQRLKWRRGGRVMGPAVRTRPRLGSLEDRNAPGSLLSVQNLVADAAVMASAPSDPGVSTGASWLPMASPSSATALSVPPLDFAAADPVVSPSVQAASDESSPPASAVFAIDSDALMGGGLPAAGDTALPRESPIAGAAATGGTDNPAVAADGGTPLSPSVSAPAAGSTKSETPFTPAPSAAPANPSAPAPPSRVPTTGAASTPLADTATTTTTTPVSAGVIAFSHRLPAAPDHPTHPGSRPVVRLAPGPHRTGAATASRLASPPAAQSRALFAPAADPAPQEITDLYNTGQTDAHTPLGSGSTDTHYFLGTDDFYRDAIVVGVPGAGWVGNVDASGTGNAAWIGKVADQTQSGRVMDDPAQYYDYRTSFTVAGAGYDAAGTVLTAQISGDDTVYQVVLNGRDIGYTAGGPTDYTSFHSLVIDGGTNSQARFVAGTNTLDFVVANAPGAANNPSGLIVDFTGAETPPSPPPALTAVDDEAQTVAGGTVSIPVLANDTYPAADVPGQTLTVQIVSAPEAGTATVNADGTVTYTSDGSAGPDNFTYQISDAAGHTSSATVNVQVAAFGAFDDSAATVVNGGVVIPVLDNDVFPDYENVTVTVEGATANGG